MHIERLGIDIGRVITCGTKDGADTFFQGNHLENPRTDDSFESIGRLVRERFGSETYLVSKCKDVVQMKTLKWLTHHRFYDETGISPRNVYFCRTRKGKVPICESLRITHFIDDKLEILSYLHELGIQNLYLFDPSEKEVNRYKAYLEYVTKVSGWNELVEVLL